ncbi:hypothetical protein UFOVP1290_643 [uncultured Caudovirales phage]|uniref:Uncharacterized protein n=1 Tax=uncultured Caudovirales phage TaxID=2100421 RepID=A0A6J5RID7_9CAUD|nr:hypothetical protein UFOVP1290_643 [uncultured Caudovirales phage]
MNNCEPINMNTAINLEIEVDTVDVLIQDYKELDKKCDKIITKIKSRKHNNTKKK